MKFPTINATDPTPDDVDAGTDAAGDKARVLVNQWRRLGVVVPTDAAYLIAKSIRSARVPLVEAMQKLTTAVGDLHLNDEVVGALNREGLAGPLVGAYKSAVAALTGVDWRPPYCPRRLADEGQAYPRSCPDCGHGACKHELRAGHA